MPPKKINKTNGGSGGGTSIFGWTIFTFLFLLFCALALVGFILSIIAYIRASDAQNDTEGFEFFHQLNGTLFANTLNSTAILDPVVVKWGMLGDEGKVVQVRLPFIITTGVTSNITLLGFILAIPETVKMPKIAGDSWPYGDSSSVALSSTTAFLDSVLYNVAIYAIELCPPNTCTYKQAFVYVFNEAPIVNTTNLTTTTLRGGLFAYETPNPTTFVDTPLAADSRSSLSKINTKNNNVRKMDLTAQERIDALFHGLPG